MLESNDRTVRGNWVPERGEGQRQSFKEKEDGKTPLPRSFLHRVHPLGTKTPNFSKKGHGVRWVGVRMEEEGEGET